MNYVDNAIQGRLQLCTFCSAFELDLKLACFSACFIIIEKVLMTRFVFYFDYGEFEIVSCFMLATESLNKCCYGCGYKRFEGSFILNFDFKASWLILTISEGLNAQDSRDLGRIIHRFGGQPVGSFMQPPARLLVPSMAHALIFDQTHDNESPIQVYIQALFR